MSPAVTIAAAIIAEEVRRHVTSETLPLDSDVERAAIAAAQRVYDALYEARGMFG